MATRTETITLNQDDIKEAISDWLHNKYGPPKPDLQFRPELGQWSIVLQYHPRQDDPPVYTAEATRKLP